jgi:hypothetical protein
MGKIIWEALWVVLDAIGRGAKWLFWELAMMEAKWHDKQSGR